MELSTFKQDFVLLDKNGRLSFYHNLKNPDYPYLILLPGSFSPAQQYSGMISHLPDTINVYDTSCYQGNHAETWATAFGVNNFYGLEFVGWADLYLDMIKAIINGANVDDAYADYSNACVNRNEQNEEQEE